MAAAGAELQSLTEEVGVLPSGCQTLEDMHLYKRLNSLSAYREHFQNHC